jgi:hypothetical protein
VGTHLCSHLVAQSSKMLVAFVKAQCRVSGVDFSGIYCTELRQQLLCLYLVVIDIGVGSVKRVGRDG